MRTPWCSRHLERQERVMKTRRRFKQTVPLEERLRILASADRERALTVPAMLGTEGSAVESNTRTDRVSPHRVARFARTATASIGQISKKAPGQTKGLFACRIPKVHATPAAFLFTPLRIASVLSLVFVAVSSLRLVVRERTTSSWPSCSAHAISVP